MKNFSYSIFIRSSLVIGLLTFIGMMASWAFVESYPDTGLIWKIVTISFFVFNWEFVLIGWLIGGDPNAIFFISGILLNCLLNGFIIERIFAWRKRKRKNPPVPTSV